MQQSSRLPAIIGLAAGVLGGAGSALLLPLLSNDSAKLQTLRLAVDANEAAMAELAQKASKPPSSEAVLLVGSVGYSVANTSHGPFVISLTGIEQYGDATKLRLRIGNLTAGSVTSASLHIRYGTRPPMPPEADFSSPKTDQWRKDQWAKKYEDWRSTVKNSDVSTSVILESGAWTVVEAIVGPAQSQDIGFITVEMQVDKIRLR